MEKKLYMAPELGIFIWTLGSASIALSDPAQEDTKTWGGWEVE